MTIRPNPGRYCVGLLLLWLPVLQAAAGTLTLFDAVTSAQGNDPWLTGSELRQQALEARSTAAGTLPDPVVSVGFANLPTDTFEFDQEAMTQFKLGVSQRFPRGDSRELDSRRLAQLGRQHPLQRADRRARVAVTVSHLWLEAYRAQESIRLIEQDRALFEHLVDVAQSSYASALGRTRQQDLVRAQLELTRLEDRLALLHQHLDTSRSSLGEWLQDPGADRPWLALPEIATAAPALEPARPQLLDGQGSMPRQELARQLAAHPALLSLDSRIAAGDTGVALAQQQYRPQWSVNASYGYREDDPSGPDRADFFSVGVAFDLPLFTGKRQDRQLQSAVASAEALRTEKALLLRKLVAAFESERARLLRLEQRRKLYSGRLLREMHEQAEASLSAYTSDNGDFAEVVRSCIAELNARIEALDIEVDRLKAISQINYFFATGEHGNPGAAS